MTKAADVDDLTRDTVALQEDLHQVCRRVLTSGRPELEQANILLSALTYELVLLTRTLGLADAAVLEGFQKCLADTPAGPLPH